MTKEEKLITELKGEYLNLVNCEDREEEESIIANFEDRIIIDVVETVEELNKEYDLNLDKIEDNGYASSHFHDGGWYVSKEGYFVRFWDRNEQRNIKN